MSILAQIAFWSAAIIALAVWGIAYDIIKYGDEGKDG